MSAATFNHKHPRKLIEEICQIVKEACAKDSNIFGYGIWTHHITEVAKHAKELAPVFGADREIVEIAALLHDYASVKDENLYKDHHLHGPIEAENLLSRFNYPTEKIEAVKHAIAAHRASTVVDKRSAEASCLANADAMAHIQNVPSLLYLAYNQHGMGIDEGALWVKSKLERSWKKLNAKVKKMAEKNYHAAIQTLSKNHKLKLPG